MNKKVGTGLIVTFVVLALIVVVSAIVIFRSIINSGLTAGPDQMFGDQHLKTSVALIELHKTRYGRYPASLSELKFVGQWDLIALQSVSYQPNEAGTAYYLEVQRGWMGKPQLEMPDEFWQGTGYDEALEP